MPDADFPPGWRVVTASVTGPYHVDAGRENQDAVRYRPLDSGLTLAIADGAGSRPRSAVGAQLAVDAAIDAAATCVTGPLVSPDAAAAAGRRFRDQCLHNFSTRLSALLTAAPGHRAEDYAATLLAVVAQPPYFLYVVVGDCFLVLAHGGAARLVVPPDREAVGNQTVFLTSADCDSAARHQVLVDDQVIGLAVATDGLVEATLTSVPAAGGGRDYAAPPEFSRYFSAFAGSTAPAQLAAQFASADFAATSGDDKSMIIAVRT